MKQTQIGDVLRSGKGWRDIVTAIDGEDIISERHYLSNGQWLTPEALDAAAVESMKILDEREE